VTWAVALLAGLAAVEVARGLGCLSARGLAELLVPLRRCMAWPARFPVLRPRLERLAGRLDTRPSRSPETLLVDLEVRAAAGLILGAAAGGAPGAVAGVLAAAATRVAALVEQGARRERAVVRDLPLALDLVAMAVEGGLPVGAAMALVARRGPPGPLRESLGLVVAAVSAGRPRAEAIAELARLLPYPAVDALVTALTRADHLGGRLAPALRAQAAQRRTERWHRAERRALLAPVRLLLPLALCIFPATFVLLLVPLALRLGAGVVP
jgi:tight adherence protein C